jgi:hypothetical protein
MPESTSTEERIARYLNQMQKAMPEIRRQIKVYEKASLAASGKRKSIAITRNV